MVKKLKKMAEKQAAGASSALPGGLFDNELAKGIRDSAQQIWLAGLGAFKQAQGGGATKVFETLVKEGVSLQKKTQAAAEEKITEVTGKMSAMANDVSAKAGHQWDKLESIFEERVARSMARLGVPSRKDVDALMKRIDELSAKVAALSKAPAARKAAPAKKAAPRKASAKKAPAKGAAPSTG